MFQFGMQTVALSSFSFAREKQEFDHFVCIFFLAAKSYLIKLVLDAEVYNEVFTLSEVVMI